MTVSRHIKFSLAISILLLLWWKSLFYSTISFLAGILIDLDHLLDYYVHKGLDKPLNLNWIKDFYITCTDIKFDKLYLVLHSFELLTLFWLVIYKFSLGKFWIAIAIGFTQHMLLDKIGNPVHPLMYFLLFRIYNKFNKLALLRPSNIH